MKTTHDNPENTPLRKSYWGNYLIMGLFVAAICLGVLIYIGWLDNNSHVDSRGGDNVMATYGMVTPQAQTPGVNDWNNPAHNSLDEIIIDHAQY